MFGLVRKSTLDAMREALLSDVKRIRKERDDAIIDKQAVERRFAEYQADRPVAVVKTTTRGRAYASIRSSRDDSFLAKVPPASLENVRNRVAQITHIVKEND